MIMTPAPLFFFSLRQHLILQAGPKVSAILLPQHPTRYHEMTGMSAPLLTLAPQCQEAVTFIRLLFKVAEMQNRV